MGLVVLGSIVANTIITFLYVVLGLVILPKMLRHTSRASTLVGRAALSVFAVGCALTHAELALHAFTGLSNATQATWFLVAAVPQVLGGTAFLMSSLVFAVYASDEG